MDYKRMRQLYRHVYDTPQNSEARAQRLAELSDKDSEELFHFTVELMSGRIDKTKLSQEVEVMDFDTWEALRHTRLAENDKMLAEFSRRYPGATAEYLQKESEKRKKQKDILAIKDRDERLKAIADNMDAFTYSRG